MASERLAPRPARRPELLAPAGDEAALRAALAAGADAVYFGLDEGFNARLRAGNFPRAKLGATVRRIHRAGARAYLALNTLVFEPELPLVEQILREAARAGVDAVIVQDPGAALLARAICPELAIHASTQMTVSSPEAARFAETVGATRVVLPRELSVGEIRRFAEDTRMELEVFVMGALCVSWSGQCLSSEAWGGRSANRGQCAQACRLPYELVVDGTVRPLGDVAYLLSPRDLAGFRAVSELMETGVHTLKVEGRQKGPAYVHTAVSSMRRWMDALTRDGGPGREDVRRLAEDMRDLTVTYSRGFSDGWLAGSDHQTLVDGRYPRHRGICLGRVSAVGQAEVRVAPLREPPRQACGEVSSPLPALGGSPTAGSGPATAPLAPEPGMGVVFDEGRPEEPEPGGPIFAVRRDGGDWVLRFGRPGPDLRRVAVGARVWVTADPRVQSRVQRALEAAEPDGRIPVRLEVAGAEGAPLTVVGRFSGPWEGGSRKSSEAVMVVGSAALSRARGPGLDREVVRAKLGALGGTPFHVAALDDGGLAPGLFVPVSELKALRRRLVQALMERLEAGPARTVREEPQLPGLRAAGAAGNRAAAEEARLIPLCRTDAQLEAAIACGCHEVVLDWMELVGLGRAVQRARAAGLRVGIATVRVQKPGEESYDRRLERLEPDAVLVRHWGGLMHFAGRSAKRPEVHGDFSLNVTNALTAGHLLSLGLDTVTAAHDLDERQLLAMLEAMPAERLVVVVHHHIPTFHTEHCVYSNLLSQGRDYRSCGRPCERHQVALRDRVGLEHPVIVDVGCRNTVFNASAQSAAALAPRLLKRGVRRLRVEFVRETRGEAETVLRAWQDLLAGRARPDEVVRRIGAHEQFGVTRGTMQVMR